MTENGEVVWLAFDNHKAHGESAVEMLACVRCRNKTYRIECHPDCGGRVYCAACGEYIGAMGWMPNEITK